MGLVHFTCKILLQRTYASLMANQGRSIRQTPSKLRLNFRRLS